MENENQKQLQIELKPDVASGVYSNLAVVANIEIPFFKEAVEMGLADGIKDFKEMMEGCA